MWHQRGFSFCWSFIYSTDYYLVVKKKVFLFDLPKQDSSKHVYTLRKDKVIGCPKVKMKVIVHMALFSVLILKTLGLWKKKKVFINILLCNQYGYPWSFLATTPYRSSLPAGPQDYTPYLHRAAVCRSGLVSLFFLGHVKGSIWVHH